MLEKEIKGWAFEGHLLSGEPSQFLILVDSVIENNFSQILWVVIEGFGMFFVVKHLAQSW